MSSRTIRLGPDTIFVGCTHLDHNREFVWQARGFSSVQEHTDWVCHEIAAYYEAYPMATMVHLGDGFLNSTPDRAAAYFRRWRMPVAYIWGNHESPTRKLYQAEVERIGFKVGEPYPLTPESLLNVTFLGPQATFLIEKQQIFAHHFPLAVWDHSHHGAWHVHSHNHGSFAESLPDYLGCKRLDCGVDVAKKHFGVPYVTFRQLKRVMDQKRIHQVDHHNEATT